MRKVLSFVLVLSLVLGSFGMAFAAPLSDIAGEDFEDAVNVLTELGVVTGYPDGTYKPDNIVTRAEMAVIVVSALGLADYATGTSSFSDMAGHWSNPYVAYATSLGVIAGYPDGTFKPDKTVSYDEAATMLVAALGYTPDSLSGTWPVNYVSKAKTLGILDGIKAGAAGANRGDIAIMTFQTLDQNIGKTDKDGVWSPTILQAGLPAVYETLLDRLDAALYDPGTGAGKPFVLTETLADNAVADVRDMVGAYVTAYKNSDGDILAIKEVKSVFLEGKFSGTQTKFTADDVEYTLSKALGAVGGTTYQGLANEEYVNGVQAAIAPADNTTYTIAAKVSGKTIQDVYSISSWTLAGGAHDQVTATDLARMNDKTPKLLGKTFKLDVNQEIDYDAFELIGVDSLDDIEKDNVVYVYVGGGYITKIAVGTEVVSGEITRISGTGADTKYTIGGKAYKVAAQTVTGFNAGNLAVDNEVEVYLDADGKIYAEELLTGKASTYAIALAGSEGTAGISDAKIRLFLADGTEEVFTIDTDKVSFDWNSDGTGTVAVDANDLVKYGLNSDGEINSLTVVTPTAATTKAVTKAGYVDGYKVAEDAFIVLDADITGTAFALAAGATEYSIGKLASLLDDTYTDVVYVKDSNDKIVVLVIEGAGSGSDAIYGVLNGVFSTSDIDNGAILMVDGEDVEYSADAAVTAANDQYLYKIVVKTNGDVTLDYLDAISDAEMINDGVGTTWTAAYIENSRIKAPAVGGGTALNSPIASDVVVYVYDADDGWTLGTTSDIDVSSTIVVYATDSDNPGLVTFVLVQ
jgi:hypothetical protein